MLKKLTNTIAISDICTVLEGSGVGTRVLDAARFRGFLLDALGTYEFPGNGQGFVRFPPEWIPQLQEVVGTGVGLNEGRSDEDFVVRTWRGRRSHYLKREFAAPLEGLACVVYTKAAYLADPDVQQRTAYHAALVADQDVKHVLVAVLGFSGPKAPLGPMAMIHNMAGGNNAFLPTGDAVQDLAMLDAWIQQAKEIEAYWTTYSLVAD